MKDEAGFLDAIREDPSDDIARLVYADWLDERGDARAEYLRVEHQLAQATKRLAELRKTLDPAWLSAVRRPPAESLRTVSLRSGREVRIDSLNQGRTYAGLLFGTPHDTFNQNIIDRLMRVEREKGVAAGEPYLVPPVVRPITLPAICARPRGRPESLPDVFCVARFVSYSPARDSAKDLSELTVIWFQDHFAFPIDAEVLDHLRGLDWENRAIDFEW